ncbi:SRPBCC family protein [Mycobacterium sp. smrl_JER01]|uniref:SRPBCC family protein n=1 Tax=Mycobacterium sp. smrl_JER01 TaxID=3402633 RepID=UPI003AC5BA0B
MAIKGSREVSIEATADEILDVIADIESAPSWTSQYQRAEVLDTYEDGRPRRAQIGVRAAGMTDTHVIEYTWADNSVRWTLLSAGHVKSQNATYTLTPADAKTRVRFDMAIELTVPLPGFVVKMALKSGLDTATEGLRKRVLEVKND